jgi:hypothetical protein
MNNDIINNSKNLNYKYGLTVYGQNSKKKIYKLKKQILLENAKYAIIPVNYNSDEGISLITGLFCVSFPSYIF